MRRCHGSMPTLEQMKLECSRLIIQKNFGFNATEKLLWAFSELGELTDMYKKGIKRWYISDKVTLKLKKYNNISDFKHAMAIELMDTIFYLMNFAIIELNDINLDDIFNEKLSINMHRPKRYGIDDKHDG